MFTKTTPTRRRIAVTGPVAMALALLMAAPAEVGAVTNGRIIFASRTRDVVGIFSIDPNGIGLKRLIRQGDFPSWNSDATMFAYTGPAKGKNKETEIFVAQADGGSPRQLTDGPAEEKSPAWSPGFVILQRIAFERNGQIWLINVDGSNERPLVLIGENAAPTWAPRGDQIAFTCVQVFGTSDICTVDVTTGKVTNLTPGGRDDTDPHWSPDGETIVFSSSPPGGGGDDGLYTVEPHALTPTPRVFFDKPGTDESDPGWSPNGLWVTFVGQAAPLTLPDIYVITAEGFGTPPSRVTTGLDWDNHPNWGVGV